jgi:hypothetical protein
MQGKLLQKIGKNLLLKTEKTEAEYLDEIQTKVLRFSSLLFTVTFTALPWDLYFFKITQPHIVSTVQLLYTVKEKGGKPDRKPHPLRYGLGNPYKNIKTENSQDYAQKPQQNCMFMNSTSVVMQENKSFPIVNSLIGTATKRSITQRLCHKT